jgi:serine/threonine protein phosphatase 1
MMLGFIDDPVRVGPHWLRNGGLQTLASYRIGGLTERSDAESFLDASTALEDAAPDGLFDWLRALPTMWRTGNICCVHAGMDPELDPEDQRTRTLLWGHPDFLRVPRRDGLWVVHGHTIVDAAHARAGRIAVDTGAYHSGILSAVAVSGNEVRFLSTG